RQALGNFRFRRQHPVGPYVLDFYCPEARLALEVDGAAHDHPVRAARDEHRTAWLTEHGIRVLRLPARDVLRGDDAEHVLPTIVAACAEGVEHPGCSPARGGAVGREADD
ncbi:endonuclease domain-containing protein, partial [Enterovirga sp. CN4-39]|uniref:endonuclease domain-containing protein n=1 Tax=Enterovirga sp. CN4-39 TaxID=3400910 RepID=UPI003BFFB0AC